MQEVDFTARKRHPLDPPPLCANRHEKRKELAVQRRVARDGARRNTLTANRKAA